MQTELFNTPALKAIQCLMEINNKTLAEMSARLVRTETRLSRLMLHVGMRDDGRNPMVMAKESKYAVA